MSAPASGEKVFRFSFFRSAAVAGFSQLFCFFLLTPPSFPTPKNTCTRSRHYGLTALDPKDAAAARGELLDEEEKDPLWLVVGLGNPGPRYDGTRHNIGFAAVDFLAKEHSIAIDKVQCNAAVGKGRIGGGGSSSRVLLAKPLTFMNVSGESVGKLARFYRVPPARILVLYDDLDTAVGTTRLRSKGGHGGHNGMRSIMSYLSNTKDFPRVRLGVSRPPGNVPVVAWVLQTFKKEEQEGVELSIREACDAVRAVLSVGLEKAVSGVRV